MMVPVSVYKKVFPLLGVLLVMNYGCISAEDSYYNIGCSIISSCVEATCNHDVGSLRILEFYLDNFNVASVTYTPSNVTLKINNISSALNANLTLISKEDSVYLSTESVLYINDPMLSRNSSVLVSLTICGNLIGNISCGTPLRNDTIDITTCNSGTDTSTTLTTGGVTSMSVMNVSTANSTDNLVGVTPTTLTTGGVTSMSVMNVSTAKSTDNLVGVTPTTLTTGGVTSMSVMNVSTAKSTDNLVGVTPTTLTTGGVTIMSVMNVSSANSTDYLVGVKAAGITLFVVGILILLMGNVTQILMWLFRRKLIIAYKFMLPSSYMQRRILKMTIGYSLFPILLAIIALLLWITAASVGSSDIYVGATIISLFLLIASIILVAFFGFIFTTWSRKNPSRSIETDNETMEFTNLATVRASTWEELEKVKEVKSQISCDDVADERSAAASTRDNRKIIYKNNAMEWTCEDHNFSMIFQSDSLLNTTESSLEISVAHSDDYVLPSMTEPVSAFFSVKCQHKFSKNVLVRIEHFSADTSSLDFVVSHSTHPPFKFELLSGGVFYKRYGEIGRTEFCIFAIVLSYIRHRRRPPLWYYCALYTSLPVDYTWTVYIYIVKDSATNKTSIKKDTKDMKITFNTSTVALVNPNLENFEFDITLSYKERSQGWYLPPGIKNPIKIQRRRIDNCRELPTPANFKILLDISKITQLCKFVHSYKIADVEEQSTMTVTLTHRPEKKESEGLVINSPSGFKLEKLKCHRSKLVIGVKFDMNWLASEFVALGILSTQHQDDISNIRSTLTSDERANIMVSAIMDKLELDSTNLLNILKVLRKKPELYKEIIALLEDKELWKTVDEILTEEFGLNGHVGI